jgi:4-hydroxy-tetrahydrodipicolinate synthase
MAVFKGSAVAIVTPFKKEDQSLNFDAFADIIDQQIDGGSDAIVVCGSTGEAATMSEQEHLDTIRFCIEHTKHRVPVIAGTGSNCTATAKHLTKQAVEYGADAVLVITPYYNKATQNGLIAHFRTVAAEAGSTPLIMYNVPSRTGCNILPATVAALVKDVPNIVGIKEASGNLSQIGQLMALTDGNIELYSGNDDQTVPIMSIGGLGVISVVANVAPREMHDLCAKFFAGDIAGAAKLQREIYPLFEKLFSEVNPIPVKMAMNLLGLNAGPVRLPLTEMEPEHTEKLRQVMADFGLLKA